MIRQDPPIVKFIMVFSSLLLFMFIINLLFCKCSLSDYNQIQVMKVCSWCETECKKCPVCCCDGMMIECLKEYEKHHNVTVELQPRPPCIFDLCYEFR